MSTAPPKPARRPTRPQPGRTRDSNLSVTPLITCVRSLALSLFHALSPQQQLPSSFDCGGPQDALAVHYQLARSRYIRGMLLSSSSDGKGPANFIGQPHTHWRASSSRLVGQPSALICHRLSRDAQCDKLSADSDRLEWRLKKREQRSRSSPKFPKVRKCLPAGMRVLCAR